MQWSRLWVVFLFNGLCNQCLWGHISMGWSKGYSGFLSVRMVQLYQCVLCEIMLIVFLMFVSGILLPVDFCSLAGCVWWVKFFNGFINVWTLISSFNHFNVWFNAWEYLWRFRNYQRTPNRMLTRRLPDTKCINASPRIRLHASIRLKSEKRKIIKCKVANEKQN